MNMRSSIRGGGKRRYGASSEPLAEINIIPLVDVVLVLLIIFMLTAHVMEFGLEIEVPQVKASSNTVEDLPTISINRKEELFLNGKPVNINELASRIRQQFKDPKNVFVQADGRSRWDPVAQVIAELGDAKFSVKVVTKTNESGGK